jgi:hypothetical protein
MQANGQEAAQAGDMRYESANDRTGSEHGQLKAQLPTIWSELTVARHDAFAM